MVVRHAPAQVSPTSCLARLALLVDLGWDSAASHRRARALELIALVKEVAREETALKIRCIRQLAFAKARDLQEVGYPGWDAFVKDHSPWGASRTRDLVRLGETPLDVVKDAVSHREIPLTVAARAPALLRADASPDAQRRFVRDARLDRLPRPKPGPLVVLAGSAMRRALAGRRLGAMLIGGHAPTATIDGFLIDCFEQQRTSDQMVDRAREAPPKPERLGRVIPEWKHDPAAALLGPWAEPDNLHDCVANLGALRVRLQRRRVVLGMAYLVIRANDLWKEVHGCRSLEELCRVHLVVGQRSFQRYAREGLEFLRRPWLEKELEKSGLTIDRAMFALEKAGDSDLALRSWIELLRRLGGAELAHARDSDGDLRKEYSRALDMARAVERALLGEDHGRADAPDTTAVGGTSVAGTAARIADHLREVGATGPIQIALRDASRRSRPKEPACILAHPKLLAAADYVLRVVVLPPACGVRRVVERDAYTCQNPRCRRRTLRVHPHHMHERQHGGSDEPDNIVSSCPACHLRFIHSGRMSVVRIDDWLIWTWPTGGIVIMDSPVADLLRERRRRRSRAKEPHAGLGDRNQL